MQLVFRFTLIKYQHVRVKTAQTEKWVKLCVINHLMTL